MNTTSIPHPENGICLPTYAETNANRDPEAQNHRHGSGRRSIGKKANMCFDYTIAAMTIALITLGAIGVIAYELYRSFLPSKVGVHIRCLWAISY